MARGDLTGAWLALLHVPALAVCPAAKLKEAVSNALYAWSRISGSFDCSSLCLHYKLTRFDQYRLGLQKLQATELVPIIAVTSMRSWMIC